MAQFGVKMIKNELQDELPHTSVNTRVSNIYSQVSGVNTPQYSSMVLEYPSMVHEQLLLCLNPDNTRVCIVNTRVHHSVQLCSTFSFGRPLVIRQYLPNQRSD